MSSSGGEKRNMDLKETRELQFEDCPRLRDSVIKGFSSPFHCSDLVPLHNACSYGHYEVTELLVKVSSSVPYYFL